ncbi:MAG: TonB-dependent receptor [Pirellulales bacterium]
MSLRKCCSQHQCDVVHFPNARLTMTIRFGAFATVLCILCVKPLWAEDWLLHDRPMRSAVETSHVDRDRFSSISDPAIESRENYTDASSGTGGATEIDELLNQDLRTLANTAVVVPQMTAEVTTVSRTESSVAKSPAPIYVVTNEMIRRSGARTIPDVLRLVPGVHVARIDSNKWAIAIRGFNDRWTNKLLVQIDGRSVYTPSFGGVYWDMQELVLEDIERIEVIRGPGGTVWGANALNGVINIITKHASQTVGTFAEAGGGSEERAFTTARYGAQIGDDAYGRVYGKWFDRDSGLAPIENDEWHQGRGGFRIDWDPTPCDKVTIQGEAFAGRSGEFRVLAAETPPFMDIDSFQRLAGGFGLMNWIHEIDDDTDWQLRMYYDGYERTMDTDRSYREDRDTWDVDWQFHFRPWERHRFVGGTGYRFSQDHFRNTFGVGFVPSERAVDLFSYFLQDEISLVEDRWFLTLGSKFEHNDFTAFEFQPSASLLFTPSPRLSTWASVSRAVRTPSRAEDDLRLRVPLRRPEPSALGIFGDRGVESEDVLAFQVGARQQPTDEFFWDATAFYNHYEDVIGLAPGAPIFGPLPVFPLFFANNRTADSYGFELAASYQATPCWRLTGSYSFFVINVEPDPGAVVVEESAPRNQFSILSLYDLGGGWHFDSTFRYVDNLPAFSIPSYFVTDLRLAYRPDSRFELAFVGRNLLDAAHPEWQDSGSAINEVQHEVYGIATYRY